MLLKLFKNKLDGLYSLANNYGAHDIIKNEIQNIRDLAAKMLMDASLKISGRVNTHIDIQDIMKNCKVDDRYGNTLNPFDLKEEDFRPELFVESLSREKRFWNQTDLSVAEHCVNLANLFPHDKELAKWAMIHEIYETYTGDLATPYKKCLPEYKIQEDKALAFYARKIGLCEKMPYEVHLADKRMMITEGIKYMATPDVWRERGIKMGNEDFGFPLEEYSANVLRDEPLSQKDAARLFADKWIELGLPITEKLLVLGINKLHYIEAGGDKLYPFTSNEIKKLYDSRESFGTTIGKDGSQWNIDFQYPYYYDKTQTMNLNFEPHIFWNDILSAVKNGDFKKEDLVLSISKEEGEGETSKTTINEKIVLCDNIEYFEEMLGKEIKDFFIKNGVFNVEPKTAQRSDGEVTLASLAYECDKIGNMSEEELF